MSGFSARWLALREPYDRAARNEAVLGALAAAFADAPAATVTDIGCGTGATMRAIAPRLPARQSWRLVDNDDVLLDAAGKAAPSGAGVTTVALDLACAIEQALDGCDLVATSALLDLVSAAWLDRLVASLVRLSRPLYAALSYDGVVTLTPETRDDEPVITAVNRHQRTDKGFGPALGPDAARTASERFRNAGFAVVEGRSDWSLRADDREIQMEMLAGWASAAGEVGLDPLILEHWLGERRDHVTAGRSQMQVGHIDFFATPTGRR
jgi:predicted TPR repeat methyltransferase